MSSEGKSIFSSGNKLTSTGSCFGLLCFPERPTLYTASGKLQAIQSSSPSREGNCRQWTGWAAPPAEVGRPLAAAVFTTQSVGLGTLPSPARPKRSPELRVQQNSRALSWCSQCEPLRSNPLAQDLPSTRLDSQHPDRAATGPVLGQRASFPPPEIAKCDWCLDPGV